MSTAGGKKRKSLTSPSNQASISKFFKGSTPKKVPSLKIDDPITKEVKEAKIVIEDDDVPTKETLIPVQKQINKKSSEKLLRFERGNCKENFSENNEDEDHKELKFKKSKHFSQRERTSKNDDDETNNLPEGSTNKDELTEQGILFTDINKLTTKVSFTPLEQQVIAIKKKHLGVLLFVECGYRYRFFGEDAVVAARELDICAYMDKNFLTASIPVHRVTIHVSRLVEKGFKVGIVNQTETAALKAAGDNKSAPFSRKLSHVYTKATFIDRDEYDEASSDISLGRYIICLSDVVKTNNAQPCIGVYCVNPTSGDIACTNLAIDNHILSKLETVFLALKPSELILPQKFSNKSIEEYVKKFCQLEDARFESVQPSDENISFTEKDLSTKLDSPFKCDTIMSCISLMMSYLKQFELQNLVKTLQNYRLYSLERNCMHIDGLTLKNLEILENNCDGNVRGSLLWVVDHTKTIFGKRLLKRWLTHPLVNADQINQRLDAVSQLSEHLESVAIQEVNKKFHGCVDIEKGLTGIFYRKITPDRFSKTIGALAKLNGVLVSHAEELKEHFNSILLNSIFEEIPKMIGSHVDQVLSNLDKGAALKNDRLNLFRNVNNYPKIVKARDAIKQLEEAIEQHKVDVRKVLGGGTVEYKCVSGLEYLIEVKNKELSKVPKSWVKISSTKQVTRFRPPFVDQSFKSLCQQREKLKIAADLAWESFLSEFADIYDSCRTAVLKFAELDCLMSLAKVACLNDFCKPQIASDCDRIEVIGGRHPILSSLLQEGQQYVDNDTVLGGEHKAMIISGPNMGGKSSYIRQVAVNCILAQIGSYIPAISARLSPLDGVYTRMGASDNIAKGKSTFLVELEQASMIIKEATSKSLVILDELGRGTSTYDGMAIAFATLKFFVEEKKAFTLFVTHYPMLSEIERRYPGNISNHHMAFMNTTHDDGTNDDGGASKTTAGINDNGNDMHVEKTPCDEKKDQMEIDDVTDEKLPTDTNVVVNQDDVPVVESIVFLYKLVAGAAKKSYGLNVARLAGLPTKILHKASLKSSQMESEVQTRMDNAGLLRSLVTSKDPVAVWKRLIAE